jgi:hypothetical protein
MSTQYPEAPVKLPKYDEPFSTIVTIDADTAAAWLKFNLSNRNARRRAIVDMVRDIHAGNYALNGESIKISRPVRDGEVDDVPAGTCIVLDGQHRLEAVKASGAAITTYVTFGLEPVAQKTIDSGIKRTVADVLRMNGEAHSAVLGALIKRAAAWDEGDRRYHANYQLTKSEVEEFLAKHPDLRRSAQIASRVHGEFKIVRQSVVALTHWVFNRIDEGDCAWFFQRLADGAEMEKGHPIMALRKRLTDEKINKEYVPDWKQTAYYVRAWNAVREDKSNFVLYSGKDSEIMPEPK